MHLQFAVLLVLLARTLARCPDESVIRPCTCSDGPEAESPSFVECRDFDNYDDLQKVFDDSLDYIFDSLRFRNCVIPHLNFTWISSKKVKTLLMGEMIMTNLMHGIDSNSSTVTHMAIGSSTILRRVRWVHFRPYTRLTTLAISSTEVRKLGKEFESYVSPDLFLLTIEKAGLKALTDGSLKGKTKLISVNFQGNRIKVLKNSFFKDQRATLSSMDFSYNPIESLPDTLFYGMGNLNSVMFMGANLKTLSKFLHYGGYLDVMGNPFVCDCQMSWIPERTGNSELLGSCESPPNLQSKLFTDLTKNDFSACDGE